MDDTQRLEKVRGPREWTDLLRKEGRCNAYTGFGFVAWLWGG